jgi:uncharacterized protein YggE
MATRDGLYNSSKNVKKLAFLGGIVLVGMLMATSVFGGSQTPFAQAQTSSGDSTAGGNGNLLQASYSFVYGNLSTVSTSGTATTRVTPDMYSVTVGVQTNGTTAQEAVSRNANLTAQVVAHLTAIGVRGNQIGTSSYSVTPIYENSRQPMQTNCPTDVFPPPPECEPSQRIIGYSAANTVTATLSVSGGINAGQIIDVSIQAGANNVNGLTFFVSPERQQEIRDSLIRDAIASARERADIAAESLGTSISQVQSVNLNEVFFPLFRSGVEEFSAAGAQENVPVPTPILPGEQDVSTTVSVVYYMRNPIAQDN